MCAASTTRSFYKNLSPVPAGGGLCDISHHRAVPADWCVVIVDIVGSTRAIEAGKYKDVNMIAASSITAVLNAAGREDIAYIFGGDGATLLVPAELAFEVSCALYGTRELARDGFQLEMRAGIVWIDELEKEGAPVRVAKTEIAPGVYQAALSGEGVTLAEKIVKDAERGKKHDIETLFSPRALASKPADFKGLECRWQPLQSRNGFTISLIVLARHADEAAKAALYQEILAHIHTLCGDREGWKPAHVQNLKLNAAAPKDEATVRTHGKGGKGAYLLGATAETWVGKLSMAFGVKAGGFDGRAYRAATAQKTDFIKFDNALRIVMDVTPPQKDQLTAYLDTLLAAGRVFYGIHAAPSALMTCLVFDHANAHFHFVDGADGGYALAAKGMKEQMKLAAQEKAA
jgi:hypothetical protein